MFFFGFGLTSSALIAYVVGWRKWESGIHGSAILETFNAFLSGVARKLCPGRYPQDMEAANAYRMEHGMGELTPEETQMTGFEKAKLENGGKFEAERVNDLAQMGRLLIWTVLMIPGFVCYALGNGVVAQQGIQMMPIGGSQEWGGVNMLIATSDPLFFVTLAYIIAYWVMPFWYVLSLLHLAVLDLFFLPYLCECKTFITILPTHTPTQPQARF